MGISASGRVIVKQLASTDILHLYKISATSLAFLMAFIGHASAATGWQQSSAQGTIEARVKADGGITFGLYCAEGQAEKKAGVMIESPRLRSVSERHDVEIEVDGHVFVFQTVGGLSVEDTNGGKNQLMILEDALIKSRSRNFRVAVPDWHVRLSFPLNGSKVALQGDKPTQLMTDACTAP